MMNDVPLNIKFVLKLVLVSITILFLRGEAAGDVCGQRSSLLAIPALPGRPGTNGVPGEPGPKGEGGSPGPPGIVPDDLIDQMRGDIVEQVRKQLVCKANNSRSNPATSCKEIYECNQFPTAPSGYYWINTTGGVLQVYCEMETNNCGGITGGWMMAAKINMTNTDNSCPQGLNYTVVSSTRMCTRSYAAGCSSVTFPIQGVPYTKVCGRARGYQYGHTYSFHSYQLGHNSLDSPYVSGLSVTHGSPREHIWTFAAGLSKDYDFAYCCNCPCASYPGPAGQPFVGENYFCESGDTGFHETQWYLDDPLWDSQGCVNGSSCCDRGGPWFTTTLNQEVSDDIEMKMCHVFGSDLENIGVEQLEIFIN